MGYGYEAENFRVNATAGGFARDNDGIGYLMLEGAWIPFDGEWSPYVGGGLGYMGSGKGGMGGMIEVGLEAFRLHGVRGLLGAQAIVPFYDTTHTQYNYTTNQTETISGRSVFPAAFVRLAF